MKLVTWFLDDATDYQKASMMLGWELGTAKAHAVNGRLFVTVGEFPFAVKVSVWANGIYEDEPAQISLSFKDEHEDAIPEVAERLGLPATPSEILEEEV